MGGGLGRAMSALTFAAASLVAFTSFAKNTENTDIVVQASDGRTPGTETRARSEVLRTDLEERLPRSAPDALRFEPGVFVQQTSHGQGSPIIRGFYGARVLIMYDGIRLNNSTFRQGPNQYFFTLDAQTIRSIEVVRGGASTLYGTDALGGAILTNPIMPDRPIDGVGVELHPRARFQYHSADSSQTYRVQTTVSYGTSLAATAGVGYSTAGLMKSAGSVRNPANNGFPEVPRFAADGRTQLGTGYTILTGDLATRYWLSPTLSLIAAVNAFRQYDTPRTDQCPPPFGLLSDCAIIDEQFRTLAYVGLDGDLGALAKETRLRLSYQRQHEKRTRHRPASFVENGGEDNVTTLGASATFLTDSAALGSNAAFRAFYGSDVYADTLGSRAYVRFTDTGSFFPYQRGQYLDGATYLTGGTFLRAELDLLSRIKLTVGGRVGLARANAPMDPESGSSALARTWPSLAWEARAAFKAVSWLDLVVGIDRSFRAPNLDDLVSRQQTGPGFQIDNPGVGPETQISTEVGAIVESRPVHAELWAFRSVLANGIDRAPRTVGDCPAGPSASSCASSWSRYQIVNAPDTAFIYGMEAALRLRPFSFMRVQATFAWTYGEGPNLGGAVPWGTTADPNPRVPLSRIPPPNGTLETRWKVGSFYWGWAMRWALAQTRLSVSDTTDYRIPYGGTPGYAVFDLRAGFRFHRNVIVNLVLENLTNRPHRSHGSAVNGIGRSVGLSLEIGT
jgi:outer membrane receptor protein involved in Fe transport